MKGLLAALDYADDLDTVEGILKVIPSEPDFLIVREQAEAKLRLLQQQQPSDSAKTKTVQPAKEIPAQAVLGKNDDVFKKMIEKSSKN